MKNRKKYYVAQFITDLFFQEDEIEMFEAENEAEVEKQLKDMFGEHLLACAIRKATWRERRYYKKYHICIAFEI